MKPPKNFYSNLDRRKQGLPEVPEASAADAGKIIKVGSDGAYELGEDAGSLPPVTPDDTRKVLQVISGTYGLSNSLTSGSLVRVTSSGIDSTVNSNVKIIKTGSSISFWVIGTNVSNAIAFSRCSQNGYCIDISDGTDYYKGVIVSSTDSSMIAYVYKTDTLEPKKAVITASSITYTPVGSTVYFEIDVSGTSVSLPSGVTFADVYALLQAGVDVQFSSGARVYSVTSFESTNIRAHWMSDLDLTSMEVYVINLASDGTGTVASATFSGS